MNKTRGASAQTEPELVERYLVKLGDKKYRTQLDTTYGVRVDGKGGTVIGDSAIVFTKTKINLNNENFDVSPGLMDLIFMKEPVDYNQRNLKNYKEILLLTNAHRHMYSADRAVNAKRGRKYTTDISLLFPAAGRERSKSQGTEVGSDIQSRHIGRISNSANGLLNRLRLLILSKAAKDIASIIALLQQYKVIV